MAKKRNPPSSKAKKSANPPPISREELARRRAFERHQAALRAGRIAVQIPSWGEASSPIDAVVSVARRNATVKLEPQAIEAMQRSRAVVERCLTDGQAHYGINTGFGSLAKQRIGPDDLRTLQRNLVRSHNAGVGEPLKRETVRGMMLLLAASLARGLSGVRPIVVKTLIEMLNKGVTPVVPSIGSVGASGDLAPLAAIACVLIGEGQAWVEDPKASRQSGIKASSPRARSASEDPTAAMAGADALKRAGIKPLTLEAKEGLALINGTHLMAAEGAMVWHDSHVLCGTALGCLAISTDACRASHSFYSSELYLARNRYWLMVTAKAAREWLKGSEIAQSHLENDSRVQDPYSLRAGPTVLGAVYHAIKDIERALSLEYSAVSDNPLVFAKNPNAVLRDLGDFEHEDLDPLHTWVDTKVKADAILSGANFHGMPLALPLDYLAIALCHLAGISERRIYLLTGAAEPEMHQRPYLVPKTNKPGLQSGLMIAQYTAAACVNEMVGLATPASVANIPTCAGMEDYNSFGPRSAAKARRAVELCRKVLAIELLCAAQGLESHRPLKSGVGIERAYALIRKHVPTLTDDRPLTADIETIAGLIEDGAFAGL